MDQQTQSENPERGSEKPRQSASRGGKWNRILAIAGFVWVFLLGCRPMFNFDIWTHLRTGELILERGMVPLTDWYTYMGRYENWTDISWLYQLLVVSLFKIGGVELLVLTKALCLAVAVAVAWRSSGNGLPAWVRASCWFLPVVCLAGRSMVRPEMVSLIFLALWLWIASRATDKPSLVWWLPLIQMVWTNCHGFFVLGLVVGVVFAADHMVRRLIGGRFGIESGSRCPSARKLLFAGIFAATASLVNPYFEEGAAFPLVLFGELHNEHVRSGDEMQHLIDNIHQYGWWHFDLQAEIGVWLLTAASFLWLLRERRFDVKRFLLFAAFSYLALLAIRNTNIFAIVSGSIVCGNIADAVGLRRNRIAGGETRPLESRWFSHVRANQLGLIVVAVLSVAVVTQQWGRMTRNQHLFGIGERPEYYAHNACRFAGQPGMPKEAFVSHYGQSAVYIFHNGPDRKVFLDGRLEVVTPATEVRYLTALVLMAWGDLHWEQLVKTSLGNLPSVILETRYSSKVIDGLLQTPGWRLVYADAAAAVFVHETVASRLNLPSVSPKPLRDPSE